MKNRKPMFLILAPSLLLAACAITPSASSGDSSTGTGGTSGGDSSSLSSDTTPITTITPTSTSEYEEQGYSYNAVSDYSSLLTSEIDGYLSDSSLPSSYTTLSDDEISITSAGSYYIEGTHTSISLALTSAGDVHIYMKSATLSGAKKAIESADGDLTSTLYITLLDGTASSISTSKNSVDILGNLVVNGSGSLSITSSGKSCLKAEGTAYIGGVTLTLSAEASEDGHGISAETIYAVNSKIDVLDCGKDGLHAEISDAGLTSYVNSAGFVYLKDVEFSYVGEGDGIQGDSFVYASGGTFDISTTAHFVAYGSSEATEYEITDGDDFKYKYDSSSGSYYKVPSENRGVSGTYAMANSVKGIKVGEIDQEDADGNVTDISSEFYEIRLVGGTYTLNTADDGIHTNLGSLIVSGSKITASTLDQALASDGPLTIGEGADIDILSSFEGMQGSSVHINGSATTIDISSDDDGINASTDYLEEDPDFYALRLNVNAGTLHVVAGGDGLDSNGSMTFNGGYSYIEGSESSGDSPLDTAEETENSSDHGIYVYGGVLMASGTSGMVESPQSSSTQNCLVYTGSSNFNSGSTLSVVDSSGNVIVTTTLTHQGQALIASSPDFVTGETYSVVSGSTTLGSATISSIITQIGSGGGFQPGGEPGGGGNPGGGGGPGGR